MKIKTINWQIVQDFISRPDIVYVFFKIFILYMMNSNHKSKPNTKNQTKNPIIPIPKAMIVIVIITPPISQEFSIWFWFDIFQLFKFFQILYEKYSGMIIPQLFVLFLLMMLTMSILMNSKHEKYQKYHYCYNRGNDSSYNNNAADLVS